MSCKSVWLHTIPLFHANGWGIAHTITVVGGTHVMIHHFNPVEVFRLIEQGARQQLRHGADHGDSAGAFSREAEVRFEQPADHHHWRSRFVSHSGEEKLRKSWVAPASPDTA